MDQKLEKLRTHASEQSLGQSNQIIYQRAMQLAKNNSSAFGSRVLDFGAGSGQFSELLNKNNHLVTAIDLMAKPACISDNIEWLSQDLNEAVNLTDQNFEIITALEIIEHLENPRFLARELFRLLKKQGKLILSTPNNNSLRAMISYLWRGHFVDFTDKSYPAHITALNQIDLKRILQEAGFIEINFFYSGSGNLPFFTHLTWQQISFGVLNSSLFCDNIFVLAKKP